MPRDSAAALADGQEPPSFRQASTTSSTLSWIRRPAATSLGAAHLDHQHVSGSSTIEKSGVGVDRRRNRTST
jgi:hypothetical protein